MQDTPSDRKRFEAVPLFPLPNLVLFPRAVQFLHIFEDRYKQMTADVLSGDRRIAMALLRPGWEQNYYSRPAIEPVVCIGRILNFERLEDGRYNYLLQGEVRARLACEREAAPSNGKPYRVANLETLGEVIPREEDLTDLRDRLGRLLDRGALGPSKGAAQFRELLRGATPTPTIVDLLAFTFLESVTLKQRLLAETDVRSRVASTIEALEAIRASGQQAHLLVGDPSLN